VVIDVERALALGDEGAPSPVLMSSTTTKRLSRSRSQSSETSMLSELRRASSVIPGSSFGVVYSLSRSARRAQGASMLL